MNTLREAVDIAGNNNVNGIQMVYVTATAGKHAHF